MKNKFSNIPDKEFSNMSDKEIDAALEEEFRTTRWSQKTPAMKNLFMLVIFDKIVKIFAILSIIVFMVVMVVMVATVANAEYLVKTVYFVPKDVQDKSSELNLDTIMKNVQNTYFFEMTRHGFHNKTFDLEVDDEGKVLVHKIRGDKNKSFYHNYNDIQEELSRKGFNDKQSMSNEIWIQIMDVHGNWRYHHPKTYILPDDVNKNEDLNIVEDGIVITDCPGCKNDLDDLDKWNVTTSKNQLTTTWANIKIN